MKTKLTPITPESLQEAACLIRQGELVGFPTETVYGLGADALNAAAVPRIYEAKGRPSDNPLIAHISDWEMGHKIAVFTPLAKKLAEAFWPGPLTLVLPKRDIVPDVVTAGLPTVAVRWPSHAGAAALIAAAGTPIAAPSANLSGRPSPTLASHVYEDLCGRIPMILDDGPVDIGLESTVVDACGELPVLLRPGRVTYEELVALCGGCGFPGKKAGERPPAPGMKYRHYAPKGQVTLAGDWRAVEALRQTMLAESPDEPLLLLADADADLLIRRGVPEDRIIRLGADADAIARNIFAALREADEREAARIIAPQVDEAGLGRAIMNRLSKAAAKV